MDITDSGNNKVIMPVVANNGARIPGLRLQQQFEKAIVKKEVPKVIIADGSEMRYPNYILDYNSVDKISIFEKHAIGSLADDSEELSLYIVIKGKIYLFGTSSKEKVDSVIDIYKNFVLSDECKVYRCENESSKEEIKDRDISKLRLSL